MLQLVASLAKADELPRSGCGVIYRKGQLRRSSQRLDVVHDQTAPTVRRFPAAGALVMVELPHLRCYAVSPDSPAVKLRFFSGVDEVPQPFKL